MTENTAAFDLAKEAIKASPNFMGFKLTNSEARKRYTERFVVRRSDLVERWQAIATIATSDSITHEWTYILHGRGSEDIMFLFESPVEMVFARLLV